MQRRDGVLGGIVHKMSGFGLFIGLTFIYGLVSLFDSNTNKPNDNKEKNKRNNKENRYWEQYRKYNNMTDFDMEIKMKDWFLWDDYKDYSRESKIHKLIERENKF